MWKCLICISLADSVVYYWALTPSHQNPPPIGNQRSRWAVPDLCQCPIMVETDTHSNRNTQYTHTPKHTQTEGEWRKKGRREKDERQSHTQQDKKEQTSVADLPTVKKTLQRLLLPSCPALQFVLEQPMPILSV